MARHVYLMCAGAIVSSLAMTTPAALVAATGGMAIGQALRSRLPPMVFRRCFFGGLLLLGLYLIAAALR